MRQSCSGAVRRDSRRSTTWRRCWRPRFNSCRRSVHPHDHNKPSLCLCVGLHCILLFCTYICIYVCVCVCVIQEAQLARSEAERMASLAGSHTLATPLSADTPMEDSPEDEGPISSLPQANTNKDRYGTTQPAKTQSLS